MRRVGNALLVFSERVAILVLAIAIVGVVKLAVDQSTPAPHKHIVIFALR